MNNDKLLPRYKAAFIISLIAFIFVFLSLLAAVIVDIVTVFDAIMTFLGAVIISIAAFVLFFAGMIVSILLVFGVYLLKTYGFWPANMTKNIFSEIMSSISLTNSQIQIFSIARIILLAMCFITFSLSITALILNKRKIDESIKRAKPTKPFAIIALIFSIMGLFVQPIMLLLINK